MIHENMLREVPDKVEKLLQAILDAKGFRERDQLNNELYFFLKELSINTIVKLGENSGVELSLYEESSISWVAQTLIYCVQSLRSDARIVTNLFKALNYYNFFGAVDFLANYYLEDTHSKSFPLEFSILKAKSKSLKLRGKYVEASEININLISVSSSRNYPDYFAFCFLLQSKIVEDSLMRFYLPERYKIIALKRLKMLDGRAGNSRYYPTWVSICEEDIILKQKKKRNFEKLSFPADNRRLFKLIEIKANEAPIGQKPRLVNEYAVLLDELEQKYSRTYLKAILVRKLKYFQMCRKHEISNNHEVVCEELRFILDNFLRYGDVKMYSITLIEILKWKKGNVDDYLIKLQNIEKLLLENNSTTTIYYEVTYELCNYYYVTKNWKKSIFYADKIYNYFQSHINTIVREQEELKAKKFPFKTLTKAELKEVSLAYSIDYGNLVNKLIEFSSFQNSLLRVYKLSINSELLVVAQSISHDLVKPLWQLLNSGIIPKESENERLELLQLFTTSTFNIVNRLKLFNKESYVNFLKVLSDFKKEKDQINKALKYDIKLNIEVEDLDKLVFKYNETVLDVILQNFYSNFFEFALNNKSYSPELEFTLINSGPSIKLRMLDNLGDIEGLKNIINSIFENNKSEDLKGYRTGSGFKLIKKAIEFFDPTASNIQWRVGTKSNFKFIEITLISDAEAGNNLSYWPA